MMVGSVVASTTAAHSQHAIKIAVADAADDALQRAQQAYGRNDFGQALALFRDAADQGNATAQFFLGFMYLNGQGVPKDYAQAMKWFRRAADQNLAMAQSRIGLMYQNGLGVQANDAEALAWYQKAVAQGDADGETLLGTMYLLGRAVPRDFAQAMALFRKGAAQGQDEAQYSLGLMYENGLGVPRNLDLARSWYQKSAAQGNDRAQKKLAGLDERQQRRTAAGKAEVPPALQFRCFLEADVQSARNNVNAQEAQRRQDACLRSNWKRLFGDKPFPGD